MIERFGDDPTPALRERVAAVLVNKALTLVQLDQPAAAVAVADHAVGRSSYDPCLKCEQFKQVASYVMRCAKGPRRIGPRFPRS